MLLKIMWEGYSHQGMQRNRNKCKLGESVNKLKEKKEEKSIWGGEKKKEKYTKKNCPNNGEGKGCFFFVNNAGRKFKV